MTTREEAIEAAVAGHAGDWHDYTFLGQSVDSTWPKEALLGLIGHLFWNGEQSHVEIKGDPG